MKKGIFGFNVHDIAEIAMLCAIAIILDVFVKIPLGATGGSLNISMLPLYIIVIRHGWFKGLISGGIIFGFSTCLIDGYGLATYPMEYLVAYGCIAILGVFTNYIYKNFDFGKIQQLIICYGMLILSIAICATIRLFAATIDSIILYDYEFVPALVYNVPYVYTSAIAVGILLCLLMPTIKIINNLYKTSYLKNIK